MEAIQKDNVDVHFTAVDEIDETGVIGNDGKHREVDTIVCATGFDVTYKPRFPVIGKNGVDLYDKWKQEPESYLGLGCPDMPNWIMFIGPTWYVSLRRCSLLASRLSGHTEPKSRLLKKT